MEIAEEVVIVGAGIAGLATAVALQRTGKRALVLERSQELRSTGAALTLFPNAWRALDALGVAQKLSPLYRQLYKGFIANVSNGSIREVAMTGTDRSGGGPKTVHRKALLEALAEKLPPNTIRFSSKLISIQLQNQEVSCSSSNNISVILCLEDGTKIKAKVVIGCDGVHSVVGQWLGLRVPVYSGRCGVRGLAVFPKGHGLRYEARQFVDGGKRAGFIPLNDNEVYWFFVFKSSFAVADDMARNPELIKREIIEKQANNFPPMFLDVANHTLPSTLTCAPLMLRCPWDVMFGKLSEGAITVAGDAMHPMTPDLGQGACSALEDAVVLARHLANEAGPQALERYVRERRWRVTWLIAASYLSGWAQQSGSGWMMQFIRDVIFYRLLYTRVMDVMKYDCGKLPLASPSD